jgi:2-polyprenyl-3-methyl-5-hydroxy-6-metoxy-1,4-benzoquinol methylase
MSDGEREETREFWNRVADDWRMQVGDDGDGTRLLNSDPVLWAFAGDINGRTVLDAGCGTGDLMCAWTPPTFGEPWPHATAS